MKCTRIYLNIYL